MLLKVAIKQAGYNHPGVIRNINFDLHAGQLLVIIGPNGSGKTTLIRSISQVLPINESNIFVNGNNLTEFDETERARKIAVVPQSTYVPPSFFVEEVVMMGRTPYMNWMGQASQKDKKIVKKVMKQTDIYQLRDRLCGELSAGERQRIILARALAQDTPVLLMDEPTSHLDLRYQFEFLEMTKSLSKESQKTILIAMHDLNLAARFGDLVLALKGGNTVAFGELDKVIQSENLTKIYEFPLEVHQFDNQDPKFIIPV